MQGRGGKKVGEKRAAQDAQGQAPKRSFLEIAAEIKPLSDSGAAKEPVKQEGSVLDMACQIQPLSHLQRGSTFVVPRQSGDSKGAFSSYGKKSEVEKTSGSREVVIVLDRDDKSDKTTQGQTSFFSVKKKTADQGAGGAGSSSQLSEYSDEKRRSITKASDYMTASRVGTPEFQKSLQWQNEQVVNIIGDSSVYIDFLANQEPTHAKVMGFPQLTFLKLVQNPEMVFGAHHIMYIFPTDKPSEQDKRAPKLSKEDVQTILGHMLLFRRYETTVIEYLKTLKLTLNEPFFFIADKPFFRCAKGDYEFLNKKLQNEHNQRRMSRVLRSLKLLHPVFAMQLLATLQDLITEGAIAVTPRTLSIWMSQVSAQSFLNF